MWKFFVKNYRLTLLILLVIVAIGVFSVLNIPREETPEIDIPVASISVSLQGATPEEVESLLTDKIESKILSLSEIDEVTSVSSRGFANITVNFNVGTDSNEKISELKDKVDEAKSELPDEASEPQVTQITFSNRPILKMAISGPFKRAELKNYAEEVQSKIERVSGVSSAEIIGGQDKEIKVLVNKTKLNEYNFSFNDLMQAIDQADTDLPIGSIETNNKNYSIQFDGSLTNAEDVANVPITSKNNVPILIRDVARVIDGYTELDDISRVSRENESLPSIGLEVFKTNEGDVLNIISEVKKLIPEIEEDDLPGAVKITTVQDNAETIRSRLNNFYNNGIQTVLIVAFILLIFLGWREGLIAGISIPLSFLISFVFLYALGYTLNVLTLFSLILSLGILIDASLVITEYLSKESKRGGEGKDIAFKIIDEFKKPLSIGTFTTIMAFLPMLLVSGIMGKFIEAIPVTVGLTLASSLFVALAIIPTIGSGFFKKKNEGKSKLEKIRKKINEKLHSFYENKLSGFLNNKSYQNLFIALMVILLCFSVSLPVFGFLKVDMFPASDQSNIYIDLTMPQGTTLAETNNASKKIENKLHKNNFIKSFTTSVGRSSAAGLDQSNNNSQNIASFSLNLKEKEKREKTSTEIIENYRSELPGLVNNADISISQANEGPDSGPPIVFRVKGESIEELESISSRLKGILKNTGGTTNIETSFDENRSNITLTIDRVKAHLYGVSPTQVASTLRTIISGKVATTINKNNDNIDVILKQDLEGKNNLKTVTSMPKLNLNDIKAISITTQYGQIPLSTFITGKLENSIPAIDHRNGDRISKVTSDLQEGKTSQVVVNEAQEKIKTINLPAGYNIETGGENEDIQESFTELGYAMILGIFLILMLLVWQFSSYKQPLYILTTIPLAIIGVFPGLILVNETLSFPAFIGVVALSGIVVNNAIILIDFINKDRERGFKLKRSIIRGGKDRLRPILLTTITTIAGIYPLIFSDPTWSPLVYSIIFGLLFSTLLSLFFIPIIYYKFEN